VSLDKHLVRQMQATVGERLQREQQRRKTSGALILLGESERQFTRTLIGSEIQLHAERLLSAGSTPINSEQERELATAVYARLYGAGNLQYLLDDERVENIDVNGCDEVWVTYADDDQVVPVHVEPVADSDDELVEIIQTLASTVGLSSRPFDAANPELDLRLPDGSRLSAIMCASERPVLSIRRHRFAKVDLADLVGNETLSNEVADFLRAAVRARKNMMIAGATNVGKTTLLRALAAEIDPAERIVTVERALELGIATDKARHPNAVAFEERLATPRVPDRSPCSSWFVGRCG
jgi:Flp pilus assembly CpaF family ATPase